MAQTHEQWLYTQERRREVVATTSCPHCLAPKGAPCLGKNGKARKALHAERSGHTRQRGPKAQPTYPLDP